MTQFDHITRADMVHNPLKRGEPGSQVALHNQCYTTLAVNQALRDTPPVITWSSAASALALVSLNGYTHGNTLMQSHSETNTGSDASTFQLTCLTTKFACCFALEGWPPPIGAAQAGIRWHRPKFSKKSFFVNSIARLYTFSAISLSRSINQIFSASVSRPVKRLVAASGYLKTAFSSKFNDNAHDASTEPARLAGANRPAVLDSQSSAALQEYSLAAGRQLIPNTGLLGARRRIAALHLVARRTLGFTIFFDLAYNLSCAYPWLHAGLKLKEKITYSKRPRVRACSPRTLNRHSSLVGCPA